MKSKKATEARTMEEIQKDIQSASGMPSEVWLLAEIIYDGLKEDNLIVYKTLRYPTFSKLELIIQEKFINLAKRILEGEV